MATWYVNLRGKTKYFRPHTLGQYGKFEHVLYPIPEDMKKIDELKEKGLMNKIRKDDEGYNLNIGRPPEIEVRGMRKALPPIVVTMGGQPYSGNVGNGSDVTTTVEVYDFVPRGSPPGSKKKVAWRWHSTNIDNLVPFEPKDLLPQEKQAVDQAAKSPQYW